MNNRRNYRWVRRHQNDEELDSGVDAFAAAVRQRATQMQKEQRSTTGFVLQISEDFAFIRLSDLYHPFKFLKQMSGSPPVQFGVQGFRPDIVDDPNPARHYTAFVFVGYWLPITLGWLVLMGWEGLGYIRYGFQWSQKDVRCGLIGLRHGRAVRKEGAYILADLIEQELRANDM